MTDRKEALIALRDAVEDGKDFIGNLTSKAFDPEQHVLALRAYGEMLPAGSLNDAVALFKAELPRWVVNRIGQRFGGIWEADLLSIGQDHFHHKGMPKSNVWHEDPARALLLAILEALIAKEGEGHDHSNA